MLISDLASQSGICASMAACFKGDGHWHVPHAPHCSPGGKPQVCNRTCAAFAASLQVCPNIYRCSWHEALLGTCISTFRSQPSGILLALSLREMIPCRPCIAEVCKICSSINLPTSSWLHAWHLHPLRSPGKRLGHSCIPKLGTEVRSSWFQCHPPHATCCLLDATSETIQSDGP